MSRREAEKRERAARVAAYQEPAWVDQQAARWGSSASEGDSEDSDAAAAAAADALYCLACDKLFRSANAMANHQRCCPCGRTLRASCGRVSRRVCIA